MAKITRSNISIQKEKELEALAAQTSFNKDSIEFLAMMSDIEIPTTDDESIEGGDYGTES